MGARRGEGEGGGEGEREVHVLRWGAVGGRTGQQLIARGGIAARKDQTCGGAWTWTWTSHGHGHHMHMDMDMDMDMDVDMDMVHHMVYPSGRVWGGWVGEGGGIACDAVARHEEGGPGAGGRRRPRVQGERRRARRAVVLTWRR